MTASSTNAGGIPAESIVSVPGNLLLMGEYAVLEEGGLGVTIAVDRRITALLSTSPRLTLSGSWGSQRVVWPGEVGDTLLDCIVRSAAHVLQVQPELLCDLPLSVVVDSTPFYGKGGDKSGFGSSAAVAAALSHAILLGVDAYFAPAKGFPSPGGSLLDRTFTAALNGHRAFQGGRGSGYDVAASVYGGIGQFTGGVRPAFRRVHIEWLPEMAVVAGRSPVKTPGAVGRYLEWRRSHALEADEFLQESNRCVKGFLDSKSWGDARAWFEASRELGLSIGEETGVPAEIELPAELVGFPAKALGAGNEIAIVFAPDSDFGNLPDGLLHPFKVSEQGVASGVGRGDSNGR